jgi:hypothetical protein
MHVARMCVFRDGRDNSNNFNPRGLNCVDLTAQGTRNFIRFTLVLCCVVTPTGLLTLTSVRTCRFFSFDQQDLTNITVSRSFSAVLLCMDARLTVARLKRRSVT